MECDEAAVGPDLQDTRVMKRMMMIKIKVKVMITIGIKLLMMAFSPVNAWCMMSVKNSNS